jgi:chromate transporter
MLLPGPEAQQLAIYIGWLMHRTLGGIVAGVFFVIPSVFILLALSYTYAAYGEVAAVAGVLAGFKPVFVAIVVEAVLKIGSRALKRQVYYAIAAAAFLAIYALHVPFPLIVLSAALIGLIGGQLLPGLFGAAAATAKTDDGRARSASVIDDHAPPPAHTLPSAARCATLAVGVVLWLVPYLLLSPGADREPACAGISLLHRRRVRDLRRSVLGSGLRHAGRDDDAGLVDAHGRWTDWRWRRRHPAR